MKTIIIFLTIFSSNLSIYAQASTDATLAIDKEIAYIKNKLVTYNKIMRNSSDSSVKFAFLYGSELQLITVKAFDTKTEKNVEWYYVNGKLTYSETKWLDLKSKQVVKYERHYLNNEHLIAWVNSENILVDINTDEFIKLDSELSSYGVKLKNETLK